MDQLLALRVFCRVAECGSFSQAGRDLALAQSVVSRAIAGLETRLGLRLFERSTRRVALTMEGRAYLDQVQAHVRGIDDANHRAASGFSDLAGHVKIAAPGALGRFLLLPELSRLMAEFAGLSVELALSDPRIDLAKGAFDFAIRVGSGGESSFVERELGRSQQWFVGESALFAERGTPAALSDLRGLPAVLSGRARDLTKLGLSPRLVVDDLDATLSAALLGLGVSVLPRWLVESHVAAGRLLHLLPKIPLPSPPVVAVYPRRLRRVSRRVLDRLENALGAKLASA